MTRSRPRVRQPSQFRCNSSGCGRVFPSSSRLRAHTEAHRANSPHICEQPACGQRFAHLSHLRLHKESHARTDHNYDPIEEEIVTQHPSAKESIRNDHEEEVIDAVIDDIVNNALYFMSQLRVARSPHVSEWNETDIANAHQWALWVQENVTEDVPANLTTILHSRGLSLELLARAERAFLDSLLACTQIDSGLLRSVLSAVIVGGISSTSCLQSVLTRSTERRREILGLRSIATHLTSQTSSTVLISEAEKNAHGNAILHRHQRFGMDITSHFRKHGITNVPRQIKEPERLPVRAVEILCYETRSAARQGLSEITKLLLQFLKEEVTRTEIAIGVSSVVLSDLCEIDAEFFDAYLGKLLDNLITSLDMSRKTQIVHKQHTRRKVWKSNLTENAVETNEIKRRIQSLTKRVGPVGYFAREIVLIFCERTGINSIR